MNQQKQLELEPVEQQFPLEAFSDIVFVEQLMEEVTKGGVIIALTRDSKLPQGRVLAVGPGRHYYAPLNAGQTMEAAVFVPTTTKVGDIVVFGKYQSGGEPIEWNGKTILQCREGDLSGRSRNGKPVNMRLKTPGSST